MRKIYVAFSILYFYSFYHGLASHPPNYINKFNVIICDLNDDIKRKLEAAAYVAAIRNLEKAESIIQKQMNDCNLKHKALNLIDTFLEKADPDSINSVNAKQLRTSLHKLLSSFDFWVDLDIYLLAAIKQFKIFEAANQE